MITNTGCMLPARLLQALMPAPQPKPDITPYPKTVLQGIVPGRKIDWIGHDTVVFAGYPVQTQGKSWLYSWDRQSPAKPLLEGPTSFCVNGKSIMFSKRESTGQAWKSYHITFPSKKVEYAGRKTPGKGFSYSSRFTCDSHPVPDQLARHNWEELRPGEGYLDFGIDGVRHNYSVTHLGNNLERRQDTGIKVDLPTLIEITDWHPQPGYLLYDINLSPEERRRWLQTNQLTIWHLDEQHRGHPLNVPAGPWVNTRGGDILFLKARNGLVITTAGFDPDGSPGTAGAYLVQPDGRYERLETGFVSQPALSADGCQLAYAFEEYLDQRSLPREGGRILVVVDLCARRMGR
ncbi:MAG: hypothetical protein WAM11_06365 [Cyanobium sp.]